MPSRCTMYRFLLTILLCLCTVCAANPTLQAVGESRCNYNFINGQSGHTPQAEGWKCAYAPHDALTGPDSNTCESKITRPTGRPSSGAAAMLVFPGGVDQPPLNFSGHTVTVARYHVETGADSTESISHGLWLGFGSSGPSAIPVEEAVLTTSFVETFTSVIEIDEAGVYTTTTYAHNRGGSVVANYRRTGSLTPDQELQREHGYAFIDIFGYNTRNSSASVRIERFCTSAEFATPWVHYPVSATELTTSFDTGRVRARDVNHNKIGDFLQHSTQRQFVLFNDSAPDPPGVLREGVDVKIGAFWGIRFALDPPVSPNFNSLEFPQLVIPEVIRPICHGVQYDIYAEARWNSLRSSPDILVSLKQSHLQQIPMPDRLSTVRLGHQARFLDQGFGPSSWWSTVTQTFDFINGRAPEALSLVIEEGEHNVEGRPYTIRVANVKFLLEAELTPPPTPMPATPEPTMPTTPMPAPMPAPIPTPPVVVAPIEPTMPPTEPPTPAPTDVVRSDAAPANTEDQWLGLPLWSAIVVLFVLTICVTITVAGGGFLIKRFMQQRSAAHSRLHSHGSVSGISGGGGGSGLSSRRGSKHHRGSSYNLQQDTTTLSTLRSDDLEKGQSVILVKKPGSRRSSRSGTPAPLDHNMHLHMFGHTQADDVSFGARSVEKQGAPAHGRSLSLHSVEMASASNGISHGGSAGGSVVMHSSGTSRKLQQVDPSIDHPIASPAAPRHYFQSQSYDMHRPMKPQVHRQKSQSVVVHPHNRRIQLENALPELEENKHNHINFQAMRTDKQEQSPVSDTSERLKVSYGNETNDALAIDYGAGGGGAGGGGGGGADLLQEDDDFRVSYEVTSPPPAPSRSHTSSNVRMESQQNRRSTRTPQTGTLQKDRVCVVCRKSPRTALVLPCSHICMCMDCAQKVDHCPVCQANIDFRSKVFE